MGQLGKLRGLRVVGIAGGSDKCAHVRNDLGFDECVDYKQFKTAEELAGALKAAAPNGIDFIFENGAVDRAGVSSDGVVSLPCRLLFRTSKFSSSVALQCPELC